MDVDWPVLFRSMYAVVRIRVVVRDVSKVPPGRVVEMELKLYMLTFIIDILAGLVDGGNDNPPGDSNVVADANPSAMETNTSDTLNDIPVTTTTVAPPLGVNAPGTRSCTIGSLLDGCVDHVHLSDHASWNDFDNADIDIGDDLMSVDSFYYIPDGWNYDKVDDVVWDLILIVWMVRMKSRKMP
jgi:hypothetical protein